MRTPLFHSGIFLVCHEIGAFGNIDDRSPRSCGLARGAANDAAFHGGRQAETGHHDTDPSRAAKPEDTASAMGQAERLALQSDLAWGGQYNGAITGDLSERMVNAQGIP